MSREEDARLVMRCAQGDEVALRALYNRHASALLRYLERILGEPGLAEDICQEAFLRLWRKAEMFDPQRGTFSAWLYRAASNLALNRMALKSSRESTLEGSEEFTEGRLDQPLEEAATTERSEMLRKALDRLTPGDRAILVLRHIEQRSVADVSEILGVPQGTVKSRVHYALHRLRAILRPTLGPRMRGEE